MLEQWLRLMLLYDADLRGGGMVDGRPVCFNMLEKILKTSVIYLLKLALGKVMNVGEREIIDIYCIICPMIHQRIMLS